MPKKKIPDKARTEAAVRELTALGVDVPGLLEKLARDERKLSKMGRTKVEAVNAALDLPRRSAEDFNAYPIMSASLWEYLAAVRLELLAPGIGIKVEKDWATPHLRPILDLFVGQIGLSYRRKGRPVTTPRVVALDKRLRGELVTLLLDVLAGRRDKCEYRTLPVSASDLTAIGKQLRVSADEIRAQKKRFDEYYRSRRGISREQAARHIAKAWADELIARHDAARKGHRG